MVGRGARDTRQRPPPCRCGRREWRRQDHRPHPSFRPRTALVVRSHSLFVWHSSAGCTLPPSPRQRAEEKRKNRRLSQRAVEPCLDLPEIVVTPRRRDLVHRMFSLCCPSKAAPTCCECHTARCGSESCPPIWPRFTSAHGARCLTCHSQALPRAAILDTDCFSVAGCVPLRVGSLSAVNSRIAGWL